MPFHSNETESRKQRLQRAVSRAADLTAIGCTCELSLFPLGNQNGKQHGIRMCHAKFPDSELV